MQKYYPDFELETTKTDFREGTGISNLDGRLWGEIGRDTARFFSDEALVRARIGIEARYLIALSEIGVIRKLSASEKSVLTNLHKSITPQIYRRLRAIESKVRHDVITMTQVMKMLLKKHKGLGDIIDHGWVHWGLASEDVDNLSRSILIARFIQKVYLPQASGILKAIVNLSKKTEGVVIPGKTHLQTATPTTLGKEISLFGFRLAEKFEKINSLKLRGKLTGAVGNLSAQRLAYPKINWRVFSKKFVESLGLTSSPYTTQIEPRTKTIELFQEILNANSILIDLSQDMRLYIGFDWLIQEARKAESGSSAMPQKVNPIDFENSQGNALLANWIFEGLVRQLPVSWLQRDLTDKTIQRNLGLPLGFSVISLISAVKGLSRVEPNIDTINDVLNEDWSGLAEAYQITLRAEGVGDAYNDLKSLARGRRLKESDIKLWIESLKVNPRVKKRLQAISFQSYTGYARENCRAMLAKIISIQKSLSR